MKFSQLFNFSFFRSQPSEISKLRQLRSSTPSLIIAMADAYMDRRTERERLRIYSLLEQCRDDDPYDPTFTGLVQEVRQDILEAIKPYQKRHPEVQLHMLTKPNVRSRYAAQMLLFLKKQKEAIIEDNSH